MSIRMRLTCSPGRAFCAASLLAIALAGTSTGQGAGTQGVDYETVPPEPSALEQQLAAAAVSMPKAMSAAENAAGGVAISARAVTGADGSVTYEFLCTAGGVMKRVEVDGATGKVTAATLTLNSAVQKALEKVPGVVRSADGNMLADPPIYKVVILTDHRTHEVSVDATSGAIVADDVKGRFPGVLTEAEIKETPSGLRYIDVVEGTGEAPAGASAVVKVHYTGYLVDGNKFDSSVDRGQPAEFPLSGVIPGWTEGVGSMKVGGKRKLIVPYKLAYGERGRGPIPPKATLIFDVELLETKAGAPPTPGGAR